MLKLLPKIDIVLGGGKTIYRTKFDPNQIKVGIIE
jgi:hypothetical protein